MITTLGYPGDIFQSTCEALVDPVDTTGAQGAGLAKLFRNRYRYECGVFSAAANRGDIRIGKVFLVRKSFARLIVFFPTKRHWKHPSQLQDIAAGLDDLVETLLREGVTSVAIPALGAGLGGLPWMDVYPLILEAARRIDVHDGRIEIYAPQGEGEPR